MKNCAISAEAATALNKTATRQAGAHAGKASVKLRFARCKVLPPIPPEERRDTKGVKDGGQALHPVTLCTSVTGRRFA